MSLQPVDEDAGDTRPFVGLSGLFFDNRGQSHHLVGRSERKVRCATGPDLLDHLLVERFHLGDDFVAREAAHELVGLGKQGPVLRNFTDFADQDAVVAQALDDLRTGQSLGDGDRLLDLLAADQRVDHRSKAGVLLEEIFAGPHLSAFALDREHDVEKERTVDDAFRIELLDDVGKVRMRRDVDILVGGKRARLPQTIL